MPSKDIEHIYIQPGLNEKLEAFCTISINGGDMLGQLSPQEIRDMAFGWLKVAEAAESDAIVAKMLTEDIGVDLGTAVGFIAKMRDYRSDSD